MADVRRIKIVFGHNSAADCPISVKYCGSSFSQNFGNGTDTRVPQNVFLFSQCSLGFGEQRLSYRLRYTCLLNLFYYFYVYYLLYGCVLRP